MRRSDEAMKVARRLPRLSLAACSLVMSVEPAWAQKVDVIGAVEKGLVRVAYTLRFDKGEAPYGGIWPYYHAASGEFYWKELEDFVAEERPAERLGFVLSPTTVITVDPLIHARFIERIVVRAEGRDIRAWPMQWGLDRPALVLQLEAPLVGAEPLRFDPSSDGPFVAVRGAEIDGEWTHTTSPVSLDIAQSRSSGAFVALPEESLIVTAEGRPAALALGRRAPVAPGWRQPPDAWRLVSAAELERLVAALEAAAGRQIVRVALSFRSPQSDQPRGMMGFQGADEDEATERNSTGVLMDGRRVLVLEALKPAVTARLERLRVHLADDRTVPATFRASLRDYGAFVVELDEPLSRFSSAAGDILSYRDRLMLAAEVRVQGENRIAYHGHSRIHSFEIGWRGQVYPNVAGDSGSLFLYDVEGALAAIPLARRLKITAAERWDEDEADMTPVSYLRAVLDDLEAHSDVGNVPLSEEQEHRLAWLGVELQPLGQELARVHNLSDQTNDGETAALIIHVYGGSPAAEAGLLAGDVLLRLHVQGQPRPLEVEADEDAYGFGVGGYPWDHWDELPEEYFDQVPPPWPPVDGGLNTKLTELGFGTPFTAEFARDGRILTHDFVVSEGPPYYQSARRAKSEAVGLTVRDLTYEVRRYFQLGPDEAGVIISKLEEGGRAAVAGLRPYELILSIDDKPLSGASEFEAALTAAGDHRLFVKRMTEGRIVKVRTD